MRISDGRCASRTSRKVYGVRPTARSPKFSRSDLEMQRFESCRLSQPVRLQRVTYEGRAKPRGTAWFRRYELVSVCGIWQWRGRPGPGARAFRRARMARLPPSRHAVHRGLWILISERETIPPQELVSPRCSRNLPYAKTISPEDAPLRPERHVPNSIATMRRKLVVALVATLSRCPCCAAPIATQSRHRNL